MNNSISIPSSHLKYLIPGYKQRLEEIDLVIRDLELERKEISNIINSVNNDTQTDLIPVLNDPQVLISNYDKNSSWFAKAKFILRKEGKPLTTSQIVDAIINYQPELNRILAVRNISSILGTKSKEGKEIERFSIKGKDQKFGLK